jgi:hypothetical protein
MAGKAGLPLPAARAAFASVKSEAHWFLIVVVSVLQTPAVDGIA